MVGHALLATGRFPSTRGIVANVWMDRETDEPGHSTQECNLEHAGSSDGHCPTLLTWVEAQPPSGTAGETLVEVIHRQRGVSVCVLL